LDADREPVHAGFAVAAEFLGLEGPGIRLQGDLAIGRKRQPRAKRRDQSIDRGRRKEAGRAASEENTGDAPPPDVGKRKLEVGHERFDVGLLRNVSPRLVGIEIAVVALLHAPGNMDVESEGREHAEPDAGGREDGDIAFPSSPEEGWRPKAAGVVRHQTPSFSFASSRRSALPRWLTRSFCSGSSSAAVLPKSRRKKCGS